MSTSVIVKNIFESMIWLLIMKIECVEKEAGILYNISRKECVLKIPKLQKEKRKKEFVMKIEIDTHSHTLASGHAYNTIREMAQAASEKGLKALAITEHAPKMPGSSHLYYFQNLKVVPRQMYGIDLLLGSELNILNEKGEVDLSQDVLATLDLTIASMHMPCYEGSRDKERVTEAYLTVMENPYVDIIGHPDDGRFPVDFEALAKQAKRTGTLLEVNNASLNPTGFRKNTKQNCLEMLRICKKCGVMVVLGSDSHVDADIARYPYVEEVLRETDFPEELIANTSFDKFQRILKRNLNGASKGEKKL